MSLDIYLYDDYGTSQQGSGIFVRENGQTVEISRQEWDDKFPDREPVVVQTQEDDHCVYRANITHNLNKMAHEADLYLSIWHPETLGIIHAKEMIPILTDGIIRLKAQPGHYRQWNPVNGWGSYETLVAFVEKYLAACRAYPKALIKVSR